MKLYQIVLTAADAKLINAGEKLPKYDAHLIATFGEFPGQGFYSHVADLDCDDLDEAFHIGNMGPESKIKRLDRMHSVSVGDVLVMQKAWIVKPFGFELVPNWQ